VLNFANGNLFANGRAQYFDHAPDAVAEGTAKIFVRIEAPGLDAALHAQLDTGAAWSVLNAEIAEALGLLPGSGEEIKLTTRLGPFNGRLEEATLTILAEEGQSLEVNARVFVSADWNHQTFLGYMGLLERIRFGLDPQANQFYFGGY
jgi:predicted aspartyl protease